MPGYQLLLVERIAQAEHRHGVLCLHEALGGLGPDPLRGGVGGDEIRVRALDLAQLPEEGVVLGVAYLGPVEYVVEVVVAVELVAQRRGFRFYAGVSHLRIRWGCS